MALIQELEQQYYKTAYQPQCNLTKNLWRLYLKANIRATAQPQ